MSAQDPDRRLVPRWRRWKTSAALGQAASAYAVTDPVVPDEVGLRSAEIAWQANRTLGHAGDFLGAAVVNGMRDRARDAATFVLEAGPRATEAARRLAKIVRNEDETTSPESVPQMVTKKVRGLRVRNLRNSLRDTPTNPLLHVDLAREYTVLGLPDRAVRPIEIAVSLAPTNRFVLRSAARFFLHHGDPERAHEIVRRAKNLTHDPWLLAAEIAIAGANRKTSRFVRQARGILQSKQTDPFHTSELAGALGTLEFHAGKSSKTRQLFRLSLVSPTENAVAQAGWVSRRLGKIDLQPEVLNTPRPYEANAWLALKTASWQFAITSANLWLLDEPFSDRPAAFGSWVALETTGDYAQAEKFAKRGLETSPGNFLLVNNLIVALASADRVSKATEVFGKLRASQIEDAVQPVFLATSGLIKYRLGIPEEGRLLYERAVKLAKDRREFRYVASALLYSAREEFRHDPARAERLLQEGKAALNQLTPSERIITECLLDQIKSGTFRNK